jgi:hypothetical protein
MKKKIQQLFSPGTIKKTLLNFAYVLFLFSLLYRFTKDLLITHGYDSWPISEFLINYQGGFVRRGLTGEIMFLLAKTFNIDIEWTIKIFCLTCFTTVCTFFIRTFLKKGYSMYILPLCFFLGMGAVNGFWIRKDYLMLCILISILSVHKSKLQSALKILIINVLVIGMQLMHESFAFFSLPILFLLFFNEHRSKGIIQATVLSLILLLPSGFAFLLSLLYHGDFKTAQAIWDSWIPIFNLNAFQLTESSHGALSAITWSSDSAVKMHFQTNFLIKDGSIFAAVWMGLIPIVFYIASNAIFIFRKNENTFTNRDRTILSSILIFQFTCLLPFFTILSCDLLRIFFYWISSSFIIFLLIPKEKIEQIFPTWLLKYAASINDRLSNIIRPTKATLALLMLFVGISTIRFSFESAIQNSVVYNVLWTISYVLSALTKVFSILF